MHQLSKRLELQGTTLDGQMNKNTHIYIYTYTHGKNTNLEAKQNVVWEITQLGLCGVVLYGVGCKLFKFHGCLFQDKCLLPSSTLGKL